MRLPLPTNLESRGGDLTQDAKIKNGYIDTEENAPNVVKRAGISLVQTTGDGSIPNDIFVLDDVAYVWRESSTPGNPTVSKVFTSINEFRDYEFDVTVSAVIGQVNGGSGIQESSGSDIKCSVITSLSNDGSLIQGQVFLSIQSLDGVTTYASGLYQLDPAPAALAYSIEVKLEYGYFNVYVFSSLVISVANPGPNFISPSLTSLEIGAAAITNLQFIP